MNQLFRLSATLWVLGALLPAAVTSRAAGADAAQTGNYGPLIFNRSGGGDFYVAQDGQFAAAELRNGAIEIHLHGAPFQIGYNGEQMNICLAMVEFPEVRADPKGYASSCLAGTSSGGRAPNSDALLVYSGTKWSDGNTELSDATTLKAPPLAGYQRAYQINSLLFVGNPQMTLGQFSGTLHGYLVVYRVHERRNQDIMPIRLIIG
jgi:hypothetical protein